MLEKLIDDIYEAGVAVERWPQVLERLMALGDGAGASFITGGVGTPVRWVATPVIEALIADYAKQPFENPRIGLALAKRAPCFESDLDIIARERIETDPFYTEFMRPRGFGWVVATAIFAPGADPIVFAVERRLASGPPDRATLDIFDRLRPHLARSLLLSARLGLDRARAQVEALALVGYPATVVDGRGRAIAMNDLIQALVPTMVEDRRGRLMLTDPKADRMLAGALAGLGPGSRGKPVQSFPIAAREGRPAAAAHLLPMRGAAQDIFSSASALLVVTPVVAGSGPDTHLLEALFDLSPAEARIARGIAEGADARHDRASPQSVERDGARAAQGRVLEDRHGKTGGTRRPARRLAATMIAPARKAARDLIDRTRMIHAGPPRLRLTIAAPR